MLRSVDLASLPHMRRGDNGSMTPVIPFIMLDPVSCLPPETRQLCRFKVMWEPEDAEEGWLDEGDMLHAEKSCFTDGSDEQMPIIYDSSIEEILYLLLF